MIKSGMGGGAALVSFELPSAVSAASVSVCGDFNDWSPVAQPLSRVEGGGFRAVVELPVGRRWRFRYLLDGQRWENDWAADDYIPNDFGSQDSVVDLTTGTLPPVSVEPEPVSVEPESVSVEPESATARTAAVAATFAVPAADSSGTARPAAKGRKRTVPESSGKDAAVTAGTAGTPAKTRKRAAAQSSGSEAAAPKPPRKRKAAGEVTQLRVTPDPAVGATTPGATPSRRKQPAKRTE